MPDKTFYVEHRIGEEWVEYEYDVKYEYSPYVPAQISGPPERCYPAEGGDADDFEGPLRRRLTDPKDSPWETVPFSVFLEGIVESKHYQDDPADKPYRKTALDKAMGYVQEELAEAGVEHYQSQHESAMEAKADQDRDDMRDGSYWSSYDD